MILHPHLQTLWQSARVVLGQPDDAAGLAPQPSFEPDRLLPGEDPCSAVREDAAHWVRVYLEVCTTKARMIEDLRALIEAQSPDARAGLSRADIPPLEDQLRRFQRRLGYWQRRQEELIGEDAASGA